jgi:hypothetical protein
LGLLPIYKPKEKMKISRRLELVNDLKELQSDEYDSHQVASMTKRDIVDSIIECAYYYKEQVNK